MVWPVEPEAWGGELESAAIGGCGALPNAGSGRAAIGGELTSAALGGGGALPNAGSGRAGSGLG